MVRSWLCYLAALTAATVFQILYDGYLIHFFFLVILLLPVFSLLVSLPAMLGVEVRLTPSRAELERGSSGSWVLEVRNRSGLPLSRGRIRCRVTGTFSAQEERHTLRFSGASGRTRLYLAMDTAHCGAWACRLERLRVWDMLGLFSLRRPCPGGEAAAEVLPRPTDRPLPPWQEIAPDAGSLRPTLSGVGSDYDLRAYRPGDAMRAVHWKLSSKQEDLVVREALLPPEPTALLSLDHFGAPDELDRRLDSLHTAALALLAEGKAFYLQWLHPVSGELRRDLVEDRRGYDRCLSRLLSDPAPERGRSVLELPVRLSEVAGPIRLLHLGAEGGVGDA